MHIIIAFTAVIAAAPSTARAAACPEGSEGCRVIRQIEKRKVEALAEIIGHYLTADSVRECSTATIRYRGRDRSNPVVECTQRTGRTAEPVKTEIVLSLDRMGESFRHRNDPASPSPIIVFQTDRPQKFDPNAVVLKPADVKEAFSMALAQVRKRTIEVERGPTIVRLIRD